MTDWWQNFYFWKIYWINLLTIFHFVDLFTQKINSTICRRLRLSTSSRLRGYPKQLAGGHNESSNGISVPLWSWATTTCTWTHSWKKSQVSSPAPSVDNCHPYKTHKEDSIELCWYSTGLNQFAKISAILCKKVYDRATVHWHSELQWMVKRAASCFSATVCPPVVGGLLCLLSLDWLHLHSQSPLLILLVTQFTIARLGPVLGACPVMTTTVAPSPTTPCWHTNRQSVGIFWLESSILQRLCSCAFNCSNKCVSRYYI